MEYQTSSDRIEALLNEKINDFTIEQLIAWLHRSEMKIKFEVIPAAA